MSQHIGSSIWEEVAREAAGTDNQPCTDWTPDTERRWTPTGDHCGNCGWGHNIHHRDHAAREMGNVFEGLVDETIARILYGTEG